MAHQDIKLYVDFFSQPSRACVIFCRLFDLPVDVQVIQLARGDHRTPSNPFAKVPYLVDGDLYLNESSAILSYLCRKFSDHIPDSWFPSSDPARALAESALHWQHTTVRLGSMRVCFHRVFANLLGATPVPAFAEDGLNMLNQALTKLETIWLDDTPFMRASAPTLADLICVTELQQLRFLVASPQGPQMQDILEPFPKVRAWMAALAEATSPHYQELDQFVTDAIQKLTAKLAKI